VPCDRYRSSTLPLLAACQEADDERDDRENEKNVNCRAQDVRNQTDDPENDEDCRDNPKDGEHYQSLLYYSPPSSTPCVSLSTKI